jgi:hypothetical protein
MSIADGILKALQYGATGQTMQQERALRQQTLADNQYTLDARSSRETASLISDSALNQHLKWGDGDATDALLEFDVVGAYQTNPELATRFLNEIPQSSLRFYDESGQLQQGKIAGIRQIGEDQYVLEVARPDGKKTKGGRNPPMTRGASSDDSDEMIVLTKDQLNGMASNRVLQMKAKGAFDNGSTFMRKYNELTDAQGKANAEQTAALRNEIESLVEAGETPPEVARSIVELANGLEGEALLDFAANDMGLDIDAVFAGLEQNAEVSEETPQDGAAKPGLLQQAAVAAQENLPTKAPPVGKAVSDALYDFMPGGMGNAFRALDPAFNGMQEEPVSPAPVTAPTPGSQQALANVQRRIDGTENDPQRSDYSYETFRQRAGLPMPGDSQKSSISPDIDAAPEPVKQAILGEGLDPETRKAAILQAIEGGFATPTPKQVEFTRDYMIKNGYTSPEKLASAPPQEVMNIAFTMASLMGPETTMDQRMAVAQSVMNFAQFGDSTMSSKDAQVMQLKRQELQLEGSKEARALAEAAGKPAAEVEEQYNANFKDAFDRLDKVRAAVAQDDRGFKNGEMEREGWDSYTSIHDRYFSARQAGQVGTTKAYEQAYAQALPEVLAVHLLNEPRANLGEWITGPFVDLFARAPYRKLAPDFSDFRLEYGQDGKVKNMFLVTPNGNDAERGQINMRQLNARFGPGTSEFIISTIEKTQQLKQAQ